MTTPLLIIDAANVVGSVPDGWWRDRFGATERLRDKLASLPSSGVAGIEPPVDVVMVVEGKARGVESSDTIRVVAAPKSGDGDDAIVDLVRTEGTDRSCYVVTADRGLKARVIELGASVLGPSTVR
ncbi:PIN domain-containing protein [Kibdelosporangium aridum]|uniref:YacP-like NYN domain-containing protein n=1 Tax=Kibdelosporangium aridum TaxID=2030 RepID=A0A1Y5XHS2_KIBAR|nr:NYN domain-containing protein [Kibdelosporangium aridum]SMC95270.1 YacP-like NYN domain-containing protein [Kibdelosporangium aridum]